MRIIATAAVGLLLVLSGCGDDEGSGSNPDGSDDYTSDCDQYGNRVYLSEDDIESAPGIFVLKDDCMVETP